jgi:hypothetical protein
MHSNTLGFKMLNAYVYAFILLQCFINPRSAFLTEFRSLSKPPPRPFRVRVIERGYQNPTCARSHISKLKVVWSCIDYIVYCRLFLGWELRQIVERESRVLFGIRVIVWRREKKRKESRAEIGDWSMRLEPLQFVFLLLWSWIFQAK